MPEMIAAKGKYFRGDELPGIARASVATAVTPDASLVPVKP
jgi:hypothetical protein